MIWGRHQLNVDFLSLFDIWRLEILIGLVGVNQFLNIKLLIFWLKGFSLVEIMF
jgi:hypothetical protein